MIIGHQKQRQFLKKSAEANRIPHAFLFSGQEQLGKKALAVEFARFLVKDSHPDFILLEPEVNNIQISQIRELIWKLSLRPYSALFKVAVIDQAHLMNQQAQNCFLKTLEEPKGNSILILITEHPEMLVPTILSRVQRIKFFPVKKEEIENYLIKQGACKKKAEHLSSFSSGRPGTAIDFLADSSKIENQEKIVSDIDKISKADFSFRFQYAKSLAEQNYKEILDIWLRYFRNLFLFRLKGDNSIKYSLSKLKRIISSIQSTNHLMFSTNVNPKLALEILLMEM